MVVIGAGFGGINAARGLAKLPLRVTIIDKTNHHTFQPLLYQVALAVLSPAEIASPVRNIVRRHPNVEVLLGEVVGFDLANRKVKLNDGAEIGYNYLVVAAGATHSYFGHQEWQGNAPGLKTLEDALDIRRRVLLAFEFAEKQAAEQGKITELNFVVIGAGPTGVELAGAIADISRQAMKGDFRYIDSTKARVLLLEGGARVLPAYANDLSASAKRQLERLGVEVRVNTKVTNLGPGSVQIGDETIHSSVTLWAAGVAASPLGKLLGAATDRSGRVIVDSELNVAGYPEIFVIGDLAAREQEAGQFLPGLAPVAIQMGKYVAKCVARDFQKLERKPFRYLDKGTMATIGRSAAVAQIGNVHLSGFLAWVGWLFVHILFLIGFRNRFFVMWEWAFAYFTWQRGARLITGDKTLPGWDVKV